MEKVFSDILGLQSSIKENVLANAKFKTIIRGIDYSTSQMLEKTKRRLNACIEKGNVNLIKDVLSLFNFVERMDFHLQRCQVDSFIEFSNDRACMDAVCYTLIEALKCMTRASEDTKKHYQDLGVDLVQLSKIHLAVVKRGITPFELISENHYIRELWSQIKVVTDSAFALAEIALR